MSGSSSSSSGVQVVVRLRPLNEREKKHGTLPVVSASTNDKTVTVIKGTGSRQARSAFCFDNVFTAFSTQEEVFTTTMKPVIKDVLTGFESTVFAYGQTGTGKTHTMEGSLDHSDNYGVIPRSAEAIFEQLNKEELNYESYRIFCSYLEIYNEELCDLLAESPITNAKETLAIMEGKNGPFCRGLSQTEVKSASDLFGLMRKAQQSRRVGETNMNKQSSRSHCIFTLRVEAKRRLEDGALFETRGKLHMVDLAGSECAKTASLDGGNEQGARDRERMNINRSLLTLGRVVKMLKEQSTKGSKAGNVRIPYRDSKLTRILQQALGGNSKTVIVATISPSVTAIEESISTLNYASAAHGIINKPVSASYMSQSTSASGVLSGSGGPGTGQVGSIEKWTEMETRLEYMQCQVEEAKAALARKHLQQQELMDRAEQAEAERKKYEQQAQELTMKNTVLAEELVQTNERCQLAEQELSDTKAALEKTTLVLHATQKTETSLTQEAMALVQALKQSVADGDQLHSLILASREADVERRRAAKQFNSSIAALFVDVKEALVALTQQESSHRDETNKLATTAANKEMQFLEKAKQVLQAAVDSVESAVTTLKSSIHEQGGIVPTADSLVQDTFSRVGNAYSILEKGEQKLLARFKATRDQIAEFGSRLTELESAHDASADKALSVLEQNVAISKQKTDELISSTGEALERAKENRAEIRNATNETIEQWKLSMNSSGDAILKQSTSQQDSVEKTLEMLSSEMQRHAAIESHLTSQSSLLQNSHSSSAATHDDQKQLLLQTQATMEASHNQQTQLLSGLVQNIVKGVEALVQAQVLEVMKETNKGHSQYVENNVSLVAHHSSITSSTLDTLQAAHALASNIQQQAEAAKENDETVISHLGETESVFAEIQTAVAKQTEDSDNFANMAGEHVQDSEDLEAVDTEVRDQLSLGGKECLHFMAGAFLADTSSQISALGETGTSVSSFARKEVLTTMASTVNKMEKPRSEMMASFARECSGLEEFMEKGLTTIKEKASDSSRIADELHGGVNSVALDFRGTLAKDRETEIGETKETFWKCATEHVDSACQTIVSSQKGSKKAESMANLFVKADLSAYDEVEDAEERVEIPFSEELSCTPSENEILASSKKLGMKANVSKVLQDVSPNEDKVLTRSRRKSQLGSIGYMVQREKNEP